MKDLSMEVSADQNKLVSEECRKLKVETSGGRIHRFFN